MSDDVSLPRRVMSRAGKSESGGRLVVGSMVRFGVSQFPFLRPWTTRVPSHTVLGHTLFVPPFHLYHRTPVQWFSWGVVHLLVTTES